MLVYWADRTSPHSKNRLTRRALGQPFFNLLVTCLQLAIQRLRRPPASLRNQAHPPSAIYGSVVSVPRLVWELFHLCFAFGCLALSHRFTIVFLKTHSVVAKPPFLASVKSPAIKSKLLPVWLCSAFGPHCPRLYRRGLCFLLFSPLGALFPPDEKGVLPNSVAFILPSLIGVLVAVARRWCVASAPPRKNGYRVCCCCLVIKPVGLLIL